MLTEWTISKVKTKHCHRASVSMILQISYRSLNIFTQYWQNSTLLTSRQGVLQACAFILNFLVTAVGLYKKITRSGVEDTTLIRNVLRNFSNMTERTLMKGKEQIKSAK